MNKFNVGETSLTFMITLNLFNEQVNVNIHEQVQRRRNEFNVHHNVKLVHNLFGEQVKVKPHKQVQRMQNEFNIQHNVKLVR